MVKKKDAIAASVRQVENDLAAVKKRSRELLKRANLDVREYRKELSTLKKQGIVSQRINAARHTPTRYMLRKLRTYKGVATGTELAVPISKMSPHRAREYTEKGLAQRIGKFLVVPKTAAKQRADIYKGHIRTTTGLMSGEEQVIKFPTRLHDLNDFLAWADENQDTLNSLRGPRDQFGFQVFGHNSKQGFANMGELIAHLSKYCHILNDKRSSQLAVQEFVLLRFRPKHGRGRQAVPDMEPYYGKKRYSKTQRRDTETSFRTEEQRRNKAAERVRRFRMSETKAEREARLSKQREYDRQRSNDRREERMSKRLLGD